MPERGTEPAVADLAHVRWLEVDPATMLPARVEVAAGPDPAEIRFEWFGR